MSLQSPGVISKEIDLSNVVTSTAGVTGAFAGAFQWGPVMTPMYVTSENDLVSYFGAPKVSYNRKDFYTVAYFLKESNQCYVTRVVHTDARNAINTSALTVTPGLEGAPDVVSDSETLILNEKDFDFNFTNPESATVIAKYPSDWANGMEISVIDEASFAAHPLAVLFDTAPDGTELHVVIRKGGNVLEKFEFLNSEVGSLRPDGTKAYIVEVLNEMSKYVYVSDLITVGEYTLGGGVLGAMPGVSVVDGYDLYLSKDEYDVQLIMAGVSDNAQVINQKVLDVASSRKDSVAFISPLFASVKVGGSASATAVIADRNSITGDSYGFMDSNWAYIYDKYNKSNTWIPMNGIVAGLTVRTELERDAWFAPAGFNRGKIGGVIKLAWEQNNAIRDLLYKSQVNPIASFKGEGIVLFGQKTLQAKPSAFDRLNVRRLFNVLKVSIERSAKYQLFEMNNDQTRLLFRTQVNQFLRGIQSRQGVEDFFVKCDEENNDAQVRMTNRFVGDIYIKPMYVIEFIELSFVATPLGVDFQEIIGG